MELNLKLTLWQQQQIGSWLWTVACVVALEALRMYKYAMHVLVIC
jgi:hypothetical protein